MKNAKTANRIKVSNPHIELYNFATINIHELCKFVTILTEIKIMLKRCLCPTLMIEISCPKKLEFL